jgi:predicted permease
MLRSVLRALVRRGRFEDGMQEELRFHIDQYVEDLVNSGLTREEATRRARMEFGSMDIVKDDCRQARGLRFFDELHQDLRYALRLLRKTPGFTITALATLALCIGANLTMFAVVNSVLLRPLPFADADRLVRVFNTYPKANVLDDGASIANYYERRGHIAAFSSVSQYREGSAIVGDAGNTHREYISQVTPEFFATLGLPPVMGRAFTEEETTYKTDNVVILTDTYWRERFNADPGVIGRTLRMDDVERTVVGVLPASFSFLSSKARMYVPYSSDVESRQSARRHWGSGSQMIARLAPGATLEQAQAQIDAHNALMERQNPQAKMMAEAGFHTPVVPLHADHVASIRPTLLLMQAGACCLLLIGGVNLVNLLLIRASVRVKELAVRQALGASRRHVISAVLVETTMLTVVGGMLGLLIGAFGTSMLTVLGTDRLPLGTHVSFDTRVGLIALVGAIVLGIALGLPIAWYNLRTLAGSASAATALQSESRGGTASRAAQRLRHAFVIAQTALAFVLLAAAGLLGLSLNNAMSVAPGFRPEQVLSGQISLPGKRYPTPATGITFVDRVFDDLSHQPGVTAVGIVTNLPLSGNDMKSSATIKGRIPKPGEPPRGIYSYSVGGDYFTTMGFTLRAGRFLTNADSHTPQRVCVVDADFAHNNWPESEQAAIGQKVFEGSQPGKDEEAYTIVGIVAPAKQARVTDETAQGAIYYPYGHRPDSRIFVVAKTSVPPETFGATLQARIRSLDPSLPVNDVKTMEMRVSESLVSRRSPALLAGIYSLMALLLTAIGTYGVLSYAVAQRKREIALRMALGAQPKQIRRQFLSIALRLLAIGTLIGLPAAWLTGRAIQAMLFHVPAVHVATVAVTAAVLAIVILCACLLPSQRAATISPMQALADE